MRLHKLSLRAAVAAAVLSLASATPADTQTFYGADVSKTLGLVNSPAAEAAFLATLSSYGTDTIDTLAGFTPDPGLAFLPLSITASTDFDIVAPFPPFAVSEPNLLLDKGPPAAGGTPVNDWLLLSEPVTAFGAYFANAGSDAEANTITFLLENTVTGTSNTIEVGPLGPDWAQDNIFYFGFTDTTPFDKVTMIETFDFDGILLDNITVGFVVPEPSTLVLALGGLVSLAVVARRRGR